MQRQQTSSPQAIFEQMIAATNRHELDALVAYFTADFRSEQPLHPERAFVGPDGVRKNWSFFFATIPDIHVEILREVTDGDTVWAELWYHGKQVDGQPFSIRGVTLMGIQANQITWGRLYIEPA